LASHRSGHRLKLLDAIAALRNDAGGNAPSVGAAIRAALCFVSAAATLLRLALWIDFGTHSFQPLDI
jgi:hypothetical protein